MPRQTAIASGSGLIAGVAITTALVSDFPEHPLGDLLFPLLALLAPLVCLFLIAGRVIRRWLDDYTDATRRELDAAAEQRRLFHKDMDTRLAEINRREEAVSRAVAASEQRYQQLSQALTEERTQQARLRDEHEELIQDYNRVVTDTLQQSADLFHPRPPASGDGSDAACIPMPARPPQDGGAVQPPMHSAADPLLN